MLQKKLIIDTETKIDFIEVEEINYITADSVGSEIHTVCAVKYYSNKTLSFFESSLSGTFFRINRNTIINLSYIENINKLSRKIRIKGNVILSISTRQLKVLSNRLKIISTRSSENT